MTYGIKNCLNGAKFNINFIKKRSTNVRNILETFLKKHCTTIENIFLDPLRINFLGETQGNGPK